MAAQARSYDNYDLSASESKFNVLFDELKRIETEHLKANKRFVYKSKTGDGPIRTRSYLDVLMRLMSQIVTRNQSLGLSESLKMYSIVKSMFGLLNEYLSSFDRGVKSYDKLLVLLFQWQCILYTRKQSNIEQLSYDSKLFESLDKMIRNKYNENSVSKSDKLQPHVRRFQSDALFDVNNIPPVTPLASIGSQNGSQHGSIFESQESQPLSPLSDSTTTSVTTTNNKENNNNNNNNDKNINYDSKPRTHDEPTTKKTKKEEEQLDKQEQEKEKDSNDSQDEKTDELVSSIGKRYKLVDGKYGTLKFAGKVDFAQGIWYGFELEARFVGKNDGSVKGVKYFDCKKEKGLFISHDKMLLAQEKPVLRGRKSEIDRPSKARDRTRSRTRSRTSSNAVKSGKNGKSTTKSNQEKKPK